MDVEQYTKLYESRKKDFLFRKDLAFLQELQRLETMSNNYAIMQQNGLRFLALCRWASSIRPLFKNDEGKILDDLLKKAKPLPVDKLRPEYTVSKTKQLDDLQDFLNKMNFEYKLQLTERAGAAEAVGTM